MIERKPFQPIDVPIEAKEEALKLYLTREQSLKNIIPVINKKYGLNLNPRIIYNWIRSEDWDRIKAEIAVQTHKSIIDEEISRRKSASEKQIEDYETILEKATVDYPDLDWRSAGEAAKAIDTAIRGQRSIQAGIVHVEFIQDVFDSIIEVVKDEELLKQLAAKLKLVIAKWDEKTAETTPSS